MTLTALADRELVVLKSLEGPVRRAGALISARVGDASSHAERALTATLRDARDGRMTIARARRSPSYGAASSRLAELSARLVGLVGSYRESSYRDACRWSAATVPAHWLRVPDPGPLASGVVSARSVVLHGVGVAAEIGAATGSAARTLLAILGQSSRALDPGAITDRLDGWESRTTAAIVAVVTRLLSDSAVSAGRRAARDVCRPGLFHDDPTL